MWEVPGRLDAAATGRPGTARGADLRARTILGRGARGLLAMVRRQSTGISPGRAKGPAAWHRGDRSRPAAALVDHGTQGRGRGRGRTWILRATRSRTGPKGRASSRDPEPDLRELGWVFTQSVRNSAHVHILCALEAAVTAIPFEVTGLDFDNGSEFINHDVIDWAAGRKIFFTRARPYKKNDQATIESRTTTSCASTRSTGDTTL